MKTTFRILAVAGLLTFASGSGLRADPIFSVNIVGFVNEPFEVGDNWFINPLEYGATGTAPANTLENLFPTAPDGTSVDLWNPLTRNFDSLSVCMAGTWSLNYQLPPGLGARLHVPTAFVNTFVGTVLAPDGSLLSMPDPPFPAPPPFAGPDGLYLLGCKTPLNFPNMYGGSAFLYVLGREAREGEQFTRLDAATQTFVTTTFHNGAWDNGEPVLGIAEAAFFKLGDAAAFGSDTVPEPSALVLLVAGLGLGLGCVRRHARRAVMNGTEVGRRFDRVLLPDR